MDVDAADGPPTPPSRPSTAIGSGAGDSLSANIASGGAPPPLVREAGGSTYGAAFGDGLSKSTMTLLRSLRTWWATGCERAMRTREVGAPSDSAASTDTVAIGLLTSAATELATSFPATLRKSSSTVSGSGRDVV